MGCKKKLDELDEDILTMMVWEMRDKYQVKQKKLSENSVGYRA